MTREELLETLSHKPMITGFGGIVTQTDESDVNLGDHLILRQHQGEWWLWQLVLPMFQVGDRIRAKGTNGEGGIIKDIDYETGCYVFDQYMRGSYVHTEYELVPYEPEDGDIVHKRGEEKPYYRVTDNIEGMRLPGDFYIYQIMDIGVTTGYYVSRQTLQKDYVLVERHESLQQALDTCRKEVAAALVEDAQATHSEVEVVLDGVRHRLVANPDVEGCRHCSLDKVCDRFKDAICNVFAGHDGCHVFQKAEEG